MLCGTFFHYLHGQLIGIAGRVAVGIYGCKLMLTGRTFVVLGFGKDTEPPKLFVQILHEIRNSGTDGSEIVIIQLLTLSGACTEECATAIK